MNIQALTWIDYAALAILFFSATFGTLRGLMSSLVGFIGWVAAAYFSAHYAEHLASYFPKSLLERLGNHETLAVAIAFVLIFIAIVFSVALLGSLLGKLMHTIGLSPADRLLGLLFGLLRACLLVLVLALGLEFLGANNYPAWRHSVTRPLTEVALGYLLPLLPKGWTHVRG